LYVVSLDPAKLSDYAAIAVGNLNGSKLNLEFLERHQGLPYPALVDRIQVILGKLGKPKNTDIFQLANHCPFILDASGLGQVLRDDFLAIGIKPIPVVFTAGEKTTMNKDCIRLGKLELIGVLLNAMEFKKIQINPALPNANLLFREAANFRGRLTSTGYMKMEATEGEHDDLIIAVAMLAWYCFGFKPKALSPVR
jgi:hypothetical protein